MLVFDDNDKIQKWRYSINTIEVRIPNEETITIPPERLVSFTVEDNYENNMFPVFGIKVALEDNKYYTIMENKTEAEFHLRIDKYPIEVGADNKAIGAKIMSNWINDYFSLIMDEDADDMNNKLNQDEASDNYQSTTNDDDPDAEDHNLDKQDNVVQFYLFKEKIIEGTKMIVNQVFTNVTITDVILWLLKKANLKNVLFATPDNKTKYKQLFIPSMTIMSAFKFIDTYYGIYNSGTYIYIGLKRAYILPFSGKCNAYTKNEIKNTGIIIPYSMDTVHSTNCGSLKKKKRKKEEKYNLAIKGSRFIVADYHSFQSKNLSISNDYLNSNDIEVIEADTGEKKKSESNAKSKNNNTTPKKKKKKKKKTTYSTGSRKTTILTKAEEKLRKNFAKHVVNHTENKYYGLTYVARSEAMSTILMMNLMDYDISGIKLNKQFNVYFEDDDYFEKYKGSYAILANMHTFTKLGEEDFQLTTRIILAKTNESYGEIYDIFGKLQKSKKVASLKKYVDGYQYQDPIALSELSEFQKSVEVNIINNTIVNAPQIDAWWATQLTNIDNEAGKLNSGEITIYRYFVYYSSVADNIDAGNIKTNGAVSKTDVAKAQGDYFGYCIAGVEDIWAQMQQELNMIVLDYKEERIDKTEAQVRYYSMNQSKAYFAKKFVPDYISREEWTKVFRDFEDIIINNKPILV